MAVKRREMPYNPLIYAKRIFVGPKQKVTTSFDRIGLKTYSRSERPSKCVRVPNTRVQAAKNFDIADDKEGRAG